MKMLKIAAILVLVLTGTAASARGLEEALQSGDLEQAKKLATAKLETSPNDYLANLALAFASEAEEKYAEQVKFLKRCLHERKDDKVALNSLAMAYLNLGKIVQAEGVAEKLKDDADTPMVKDTLRQIRMFRDELANPHAMPVVSNVLDAAACAHRNNKEIGNFPVFQLMRVAEADEHGKRIWRGCYRTVVPSDWRPCPMELFFKVYPSGRVSIVRENRKWSPSRGLKLSYNNYMLHFKRKHLDLTGVTSLEDVDEGNDIQFRFQAGTKTVHEVRLVDLVAPAVADFLVRIARADKIVIRDGTVNWDCPTDKDRVLKTLTDSKEIAAFNKKFAFVEDFGKDSSAKLGLSLGCHCPGGPGIDWWKGQEKIAQTGLHHGKALWWEGFAWDFLLTEKSQKELGAWLTAQGIDLKEQKKSLP